MPRPPIPTPGAPVPTPEALRVAAGLRPGFRLRSGFVGLSGSMHLEWVDGRSRILQPGSY